MSADRQDVLVVGGGPAGSASAALFAEAGYEVRLADRVSFPRFKPCGDFLSPEGTRILRRLGVEDEVQRAGARELRGLLVSAHGQPALRADFERGYRGTGYALERSALDAILLSAARRAGAEVLEGWTVERMPRPGEAHVRGPSGEPRTWRARLVVGAGGRRCPVARDLGVQRRTGDGRIDLLAHWSGLDAGRPYCEMHVAGPGYTGVAASSPHRVNVNTVVPTAWLRARARENGGDGRALRGRAYERLLRDSPHLSRVLRGGARLYDPVASDITPLSTARASGERTLLAGDAALFLDPFTGQGIYLALRSAELAFEVGHSALAAGDASARRLFEYDRLRKREFEPKTRLSRLLQAILYRPRAALRVAAALRRDRRGAGRLIGVIGDYRPAGDLLTPAFLARLVAASLL